MKKLGTVAATVAALMMAATPALAAAPQAPAAKLSVVNSAQRTGAPVAGVNRAEGDSWIWIGLAAVAVIVGIILIADDDDEPSSP